MGAPAPPTVYFPIGRSSFLQERWIIVRTRAPAAAVLAQIREELRRIDPTVAPANIATMVERESRARAPERFRAALLGVLTGVAVVLAIVGLYSSVALAVGRRTREIGLRLALATVAAAVPATRASRVDPSVALRGDG